MHTYAKYYDAVSTNTIASRAASLAGAVLS